jgi:PadR family transcriptional regulator, regulatory protein PadR
MKPLSLGRLELTVLIAVARLGDEAHGLAVRSELAKRTKRDYSVGAVYTTLQRLEIKGLIASHASEPLPVRGGRSRRQFSLTTGGRKALRDAEREAASLLAGVGHILRPERA